MIDWAAIRVAALGARNDAALPPRISFPVLPRTLTEFCRKAEDPKVTQRELATLIENDTGLCCELLRYVNCAQVGLRNKASSAQHALALLGIRKTKLFLMSAGMKMALAARSSKLINLKNFWNANLERALFAKEVAILLRADADLAFVGGMLQDFLLPILTNELTDDYLSFIGDQERKPQDLPVFEKTRFGWDHAFAAAHLLSAWNFPDDLTCCLMFHHRGLAMLCDKQLGKTAVAAVAVAGLLPDAMKQSPQGLEHLLKLEKFWPDFHLEEIATRVHEQFEATAPGVKHDFSLLHIYQRMTAVAS